MTTTWNGIAGARKSALAMLAAASMTVSAGCGIESSSPPAALTTVQSALNTSQADSFFSDGNRWNVPAAYSTIRFPDVAGDVRSDVCGRRDDGVWCAVDNGTGALTNVLKWNAVFTDANGWSNSAYYSTIQFPDLNHDGKADICGRGPNAPSTLAPGVWCGLSNGSNSFGTLTLWNNNFSDANGWSAPQYGSTMQFPDLNHDRNADNCARGILGVYCALNTGSSFNSGAVSLWSGLFSDTNHWDSARYYSTIHFPDLNGDNNADVCGRGPDSTGAVRVWCALSNGANGFGTPVAWNTTFGDAAWDQQSYYSTIQFVDVNNDGMDDLCGRGPGGGAGSTVGIWCALSNGANGFGTPTLWNSNIGNPTWDPDYYSGTIKFGKGMVCGRGSAGIYCAYSNGSSFPYELLESSNETDGSGWTAPQYYKTINVTSDFKLAERGIFGIYAAPSSRDALSMTTAADITARRAALITKVWGRSTIDTVQGVDVDSALNITALDTLPLPAGTTVRRYQINMATAAGGSIPGVADHFIPPGNPTRVVILNPGHASSYDRVPYQDAQTVVELLSEGYAVLATYMPRCNPLDSANCYPHDPLFQSLRPANGLHPYVYFLDPVRRSLNYAINTFGYKRVDMAGLSGGGWTTTIYAALDTRIMTSIPIAGSEPFYMRLGSDAEQENTPDRGNDFFSFVNASGTRYVSGYKDLYLLGSFGAGRRQIQVLNRGDNCCFGQNEYAGVVTPWDQAARGHEREVRQALAARTVGQGSFRLEINEANDSCTIAGTCPSAVGGHEFSKNTRVNVILAELNGSSAFLAAPNDTDGFGRGMNGNLFQNQNGTNTWLDTGLAMTGTAAVIKGAVNPFDVFYRDPTNTIVHARQAGSSWQTTSDISGVVISDPVAASVSSGRIDVVAIGTDYRLYHWWGGTAAWSQELVDTGGVFAAGRPALTLSSGNRLDIFFRGIDAALQHAWTLTGSGPYHLETLGQLPGGVMKSFPATYPVSSGAPLDVYAVGRDNQLYQLEAGTSGGWVRSMLSPVGGTTSVWGSPGVFRSASGTRNVYARVNSAPDMGIFTNTTGSSWSVTTVTGDPSTPFIGAPVANNLGIFTIDAAQSGWLLTPSSSVSLRGYLDR